MMTCIIMYHVSSSLPRHMVAMANGSVAHEAGGTRHWYATLMWEASNCIACRPSSNRDCNKRVTDNRALFGCELAGHPSGLWIDSLLDVHLA